MTKDAVTEANRILNNIKEANEFWKHHEYKSYIPSSLIERIDSTLDQYIKDMERKLEILNSSFEYDKK